MFSCKKETTTASPTPEVPAYLVGRWKINMVSYKIYSLTGEHLKDTVAFNNNGDLSDSPGEYEVYNTNGTGYHIEQGYINGSDGLIFKRDTDYHWTYILTKDSLKVSDFQYGSPLSNVAIIKLDDTEMHQELTYPSDPLWVFNIGSPDPNASYKVISDLYWIKQY